MTLRSGRLMKERSKRRCGRRLSVWRKRFMRFVALLRRRLGGRLRSSMSTMPQLKVDLRVIHTFSISWAFLGDTCMDLAVPGNTSMHLAFHLCLLGGEAKVRLGWEVFQSAPGAPTFRECMVYARLPSGITRVARHAIAEYFSSGLVGLMLYRSFLSWRL